MNTISSRMRFTASAVLLLISTAGLAGGERQVDRWGDPLPERAVARLGTVRFRVEQDPFSLAFSPDGKLLAAAGHDGITFVFDARTGIRRRTIDMVAEIKPGELWRAVHAVCFSPDGKRLAMANTAGQIHVHDVATGRRLEVLSVHPDVAESLDHHVDPMLRFSPDGKLLAAEYGMEEGDNTISGCVVFENGVQRGVYPRTLGITPCPDGGFAALKLTIDQDAVRDVQLLDLQTGNLRGEPLDVKGHWPLGLSRDAALIVTRHLSKREVALIETAGGAKRATLVAPENEQFRPVVAFTPDGRFLMTTTHQADDGNVYNTINRIQLWELATFRRAWSTRVPGSFDLPLAFSPDVRHVALGFHNNTRIGLLDMATGDEVKTEQSGHDCEISAMALSPDGRSVLTGDWSQRAIQWDLRTGRMERVLAPETSADVAAWSPDGKFLATSRSNHIAWLWNATSGRLEHTLDHGAFKLHDLVFAAQGRPRLITLGSDGRGGMIRLTNWDAETGRPLETISSPGEADSGWPTGMGNKLALSPGGELAADGLKGPVRVWSLKRPGVIAYVPGQFDGVRDIRFSADGRLLYCADRKDTIRNWEVASGYVLADLSASKDARFHAAVVSPDGELIASAEDDLSSMTGERRFQILVRDLPTRRELARFVGHQSRVRALAFSPDGSSLLSGHSNGTTLVWDVTDVRPGDASGLSPGSTTSSEDLWNRLAGPSAVRTVEAMDQLTSRGAETVRFLRSRLQPAEAPDEATVSKLIQQLKDNDFGVRRQASAELRALGRVIEPQLRAAIAESGSAELRGRCGQLLEDCKSPFTTQPSRLREVRAVQVLAGIGSPEAIQLIEELSHGAPGAEQTDIARAILRLRN